MPDTVVVNGLSLPDALVSLIREKQWTRPQDFRMLGEVTGMAHPDQLDFLSVKHMIAETQALIELYRDGFGATYGLTTTGAGDGLSHMLDVNRAVVLAVNDDEEGMCLDYRVSVEAPQVVSGTWVGEGSDERVVWKTIAPDFETFARKIGLLR